MIKFENTEVMGWEAAIRGMKAKGYRKTKTGYETFVSVKCKNLNLGTYKTEEEARSAVYNFRKERFINGIRAFNLNENDGIVIHDKYVIFSTGDIFNLNIISTLKEYITSLYTINLMSAITIESNVRYHDIAYLIILVTS